MTWLRSLPETLPATRAALQQVAVHVLARRRHDRTGRFGLRPSPGGIATPGFGDDLEVLRTSGRLLVVERGAGTATAPIETLGQAAELAGVDLTGDFSVGDDTPPAGDPGTPLAIDDTDARLLGEWYAFGAAAIDEAVATSPAVTESTTRQIWPEHFDLGGAVTLVGPAAPAGVRANVGASPGDDVEPLPYLYVGPWGGERPGDAGYWNAPFGAVLRAEELVGLTHAAARARVVAFFQRGFALLAGGSPA
jgi:hypothetical protein